MACAMDEEHQEEFVRTKLIEIKSEDWASIADLLLVYLLNSIQLSYC